MGDMADALTEQGMDNWEAHLRGECGGDWCEYCDKENNDE